LITRYFAASRGVRAYAFELMFIEMAQRTVPQAEERRRLRRRLRRRYADGAADEAATPYTSSVFAATPTRAEPPDGDADMSARTPDIGTDTTKQIRHTRSFHTLENGPRAHMRVIV